MEFTIYKHIAFFALLLGTGTLFVLLFAPYAYPIFWAAVIAVIVYPVYNWLNKTLRHSGIAAMLTIIGVVFVILIPISGVLGLIVKQAIDLVSTVNQPNNLDLLQRFAETIVADPRFINLFGQIDIEQSLRDVSSAVGSLALSWLGRGAGNTLSAFIGVFVMLYSLYYFLQSGKTWLKHLMRLLPFGDDNEKILYQKFVSTSKATLKGTLLIGGLQGTIGGLLFWIVGIPSAAFWGLVMIIFAIIPAVGTFAVWVPAAIILFATGQIWQGVVLTTGGLVIGGIDNLLRPPLIGRDIQMHPILILFGTIGGLGLFGVSGVVIGPMIAAMFLAVVTMYEVKYKRQLDSKKT